MSFDTPHDSTTGTVLTLDLAGSSATYFISQITLANAQANQDTSIDVGHLSQTAGETRASITKPLTEVDNTGNTGRTLSFNYIGKTIIWDNTTGTYKIQVAGVTWIGGNTASYHTVQTSQVVLQVNDAIRGQATLILAR